MRHTSRENDSSSSSSSSNSGGGVGGRNYSEDEGKKERDDEEKVGAAVMGVHQVEDQVMVQLRAHALVRGHECEYLMTKREMGLGRGKDERGAEDGVVGVTDNKRVRRKAVRIRYNEKAE
jgi:hypothetical protein